METPPQNKPRERILTDAEIKALWAATEPAGTFHTIVRLLILTGQRRGEVARLEWSWLDTAERMIILPAKVTKTAGCTHSPTAIWSQRYLHA
jgi:integrase